MLVWNALKLDTVVFCPVEEVLPVLRYITNMLIALNPANVFTFGKHHFTLNHMFHFISLLHIENMAFDTFGGFLLFEKQYLLCERKFSVHFPHVFTSW